MKQEHTQGRLTVHPFDDGSGLCSLVSSGPIGHTGDTGLHTGLANAAELVRRWNAFEPGGEVEEMRAALEALVAAVTERGIIAESLSVNPESLGEVKTARAALARLNP